MTTPPAAAHTGVPSGALMALPPCQPLRRWPKVETTGPSTGHVKGTIELSKAGTARTSRVGARALETDAGRTVGVGAGALPRPATTVSPDGMTRRWPTLMASGPGRLLALTSAATVMPYFFAIAVRVSPGFTSCVRCGTRGSA